jgi:glutaredoxin
MKEITYFYLKGCPYCPKADVLIERLVQENPRFADIPDQ